MKPLLLVLVAARLWCPVGAGADWTPLHAAANERVADTLVRRHPEYLNALEAGWHTPLHVAVFDGRTEVAKLLIARGADVNAPDVCGWTPLHTAANRGEFAAAEFLLSKGADINFKDRTGQTPLRLALKYKHADIATLLRQHGAHE